MLDFTVLQKNNRDTDLDSEEWVGKSTLFSVSTMKEKGTQEI